MIPEHFIVKGTPLLTLKGVTDLAVKAGAELYSVDIKLGEKFCAKFKDYEIQVAAIQTEEMSDFDWQIEKKRSMKAAAWNILKHIQLTTDISLLIKSDNK